MTATDTDMITVLAIFSSYTDLFHMGYWFKKDYIEFFSNPTKEWTIIIPLLSSFIMLEVTSKRVYFAL